ncbi:hypothetical protein V8C86DRAFT_2850356 [Haematococcus lacustris]
MPIFDPNSQLTLRLGFLIAANAVLALYLHRCVCRLKPGTQRMLAAMPSTAVLLALPLLFDPVEEVVTRNAVLFVTAWLGSFKVMALCLGRGSLAQSWTLPQFFALLLLPIYPTQESSPNGSHAMKQGRLQDSGGPPFQLLLTSMVKMGLVGVTAHVLVTTELPPGPRQLVAALALMGLLGGMADMAAAVATWAVGLTIIPSFDQPWQSTSLADFWGRRWNTATSAVLRALVYDPIMEGRLVARRADARDLSTMPQPASQHLDKPRNGASQILSEPGRRHFTTCRSQAETEPYSPGALSPPAMDVWSKRCQPLPGCEHNSNQGLHADGAESDPSSQSHGSCKPSMASADAGSKSRTAGDVAARSKRWRRVVGTLATFLVSGLMHEWMLYMEMPRFWGPWTGKITVFFALQGPLLLAESQLPRALQQAGLPPLPSLLACALTGTLLMATATPFYFGAVEPPAGDLAPRVNKGVHDSFMAAAEVVLHHPQLAKAWAEVRRLAASGS